jgi:hypothetical protein
LFEQMGLEKDLEEMEKLGLPVRKELDQPA